MHVLPRCFLNHESSLFIRLSHLELARRGRGECGTSKSVRSAHLHKARRQTARMPVVRCGLVASTLWMQTCGCVALDDLISDHPNEHMLCM